MRDMIKKLALLVPAFAIAASGSAGARSEPIRALSLDVSEEAGRVEIQLIALSDRAQQVQYNVRLTGSSNANHSGDTGIPAGQRQVLSRLVTTYSDKWCAVVDVTEQSGMTYTLKAGDCS